LHTESPPEKKAGKMVQKNQPQKNVAKGAFFSDVFVDSFLRIV
jgi:hypothetical protein